MHEPGGGPGLLTVEGVAALDEAITVLDHQPPLQPLIDSNALDAAAGHHADDQGPRGVTGHVGTDGASLSERIRRRGKWNGMIAEDISYGPETAADVVRQLIIDDGVASRGHRVNIFDPVLRFAGVGCGPHRIYHAMCVIDFAQSITGK